ncbi:hypothetical protein ACFX13_008748 [Malus domestica]
MQEERVRGNQKEGAAVGICTGMESCICMGILNCHWHWNLALAPALESCTGIGTGIWNLALAPMEFLIEIGIEN